MLQSKGLDQSSKEEPKYTFQRHFIPRAHETPHITLAHAHQQQYQAKDGNSLEGKKPPSKFI